ncbi:FkbM family methyltransferase [Flavobacterium terrisoli]|uniref:FkbM family methyltransferase n=1 Tax=Flavobacterium terrisoli TaxID=3242195 RepID=UPI0025434A50|nr:FkbM family methyltransferase [Flavobacterium buctense]
MSIRTQIVQKLVHINEAIFFYPKLKRFYADNLKEEKISILDIGANKGQSIDFFLKINANAEFDAFEPNKKLFVHLQNKYKAMKSIRLHNFGVSNIKGELVFHENILDETSTFEELNLDSKYLEKKAKVLGVTKENIIVDNYRVAVIRLADFLKENSNKAYNVLKIDVEGHELQCLQGLFADEAKVLPIKFIQLESHNDDMYLSNNQHTDIEELLNRNHFVKIAEIKHGFGDFAELIYENQKLYEA